MGKMRYIGFIIFISGILLSGCINTEGILELKGMILDENTKAAIPDRKIIVQALVYNGVNYKPVYAGEFSTDSTGCFAYSLKKVKNVSLYDFYFVGDSAYAFSNNKLGLMELDRYGKFLSFYLNKLADFTIKIDRRSKTPLRDTLYVSWESNGIDGEILYSYKIENYGITSDLALQWIGGNIKSVIKTKVYADKKTIVSWTLFRNGRPREIIDTIFCKREGNNSLYFKY
jgi:hypothetical protein